MLLTEKISNNKNEKLSKFLDYNYGSWKLEDGYWVKEPIENIETSNNEVSK